MRLEQKTFAEKYIEKIILLVAVLIAVAIVYLFVLNDYSVEMKPGAQAMNPGKIEEDIRRKAKLLNDKIRSDKIAPEIDGFQVPNYVARFWDRHGQELLANNTMPPMANVGEPIHQITSGPGNGIPIEPVLPPAPFELVVRSSNHVVEDSQIIEAALYDQYRGEFPDEPEQVIREHVSMLVKKIDQLVGPQEPRDIVHHLLRAKVDLEKYKQAILAVDKDVRMPETWWEIYSNFLADVVVERQTLDPQTGEWGDLTEIQPLPGSVIDNNRQQIEFLANMPAPADGQVDNKGQITTDLIELMRSRARDIANPQELLYRNYTLLNKDEKLPENKNLTDEEKAELYEVRHKINQEEAKLRRLTGSDVTQGPRRVNPRGIYEDELNPPPTRPTPGRPTPRPGNTGADGKGRPDPKAAREKRRQDQIKAIEDKLDALYQRKAELEGTADPDAGDGRDGSRGNPPIGEEYQRDRFNRNPQNTRGRRPNGRRGFNEFGQPDESGKLPVVDVLSHDVTAEHGKTYRYRMVYKVVNPLYQKDVTPEEVKKEHFDKLLVASEPSEWSEPITVEPKMYLFVNDASAQANSATFEVYSIHDGRRMKHVFKASPGDPVGGKAKVEVREQGVDDRSTVPVEKEINLAAPVVLVDVKEPPKAPGAIGSRGPITVILADTTTGRITVRNLQDDRANTLRKDLDNKAASSARTSVGLNR